MISLENVSLQDKKTGVFILKNISCQFQSGKVIFLIGGSGAGKTSLLRCMAQLRPDYDGKILVNGIDIKTLENALRAKTIGFVFQQYNLFPQMTAWENCANPLCTILGVSREKAATKVEGLFKTLGIMDIANRYPHTISGGQQQRVALARALCFDTALVLLDEPTSALDQRNTEILGDELKKIAKQGRSVVVASQDMPFVAAYADVTIVINDGKLQSEKTKDY